MNNKYFFPFRNCRFETSKDIVTLFVETGKPSWLEKFFWGKNYHKDAKVDLDETGSFIWKLCDGNNSTKDIISRTNATFGEKVEPVEERVVLFLEQMERNKFIRFYEKRTIEEKK